MKRIILIIMFIGLVITALYSITVEIGDGTTTTNYIPCSGQFKYSWSNYILTAEQIGSSLQINQIQFEVDNTFSQCRMNNQQLYLKHIDVNEVTNTYPDPVNNGFTLVFEGAITWQGSGWQGVNLNTEFVYDGISNLQIVWLNNYGRDSELYPRFRTTATEVNAGAYKASDSSFPANLTGNIVSYFPNTKLTGEFLETAMTSILPVDNATNQSLTPTISFEVAEAYTNLKLEFGETLSLGTTLIPFSQVTNSISYTFIESLAYLTDYYWRVTLYSTNDEEISYNFTFTTCSSLEGLGTEESPYLVNSLADLVVVSSNNNFWNKHFLQTSNIDASSTTELNQGAGFSPIGISLNNSFTGSYAGQGYVISNLYINRPAANCIGLFGYSKEADISNLGLESVEIIGNKFVGGLIGATSSDISNCYVTGTVSGIDRVGGLIGLVSGSSSINNSYATSSMSGAGVVGGLIGLRTGGSVNNSFWDIETSGQASSAGGTGKSTQEMKEIETYLNAGWDFTAIWFLHSTLNSGYPSLRSGDLPPASPTNIQIEVIGNSAHISWNAVTEDINQNPLTPSYYNIYYKGGGINSDGDYHLLGSTNELYYDHIDAGASAKVTFYKVVAYVD